MLQFQREMDRIFVVFPKKEDGEVLFIRDTYSELRILFFDIFGRRIFPNSNARVSGARDETSLG